MQFCNILFLFGSILYFRDATGWSIDGHRAAARVASRLLSDDAKRYMTELFEIPLDRVTKTLIDVSGWADEVKKTKKYEWSRPLHFAHTPYRACAAFDFARDCAHEGCVVSAVADFAMRAANPDLSTEDRAEAVKFLVHFVADMHSPMHMAFEHDQGGVRIPIKLNGDWRSLHQVWDLDVLNYARTKRGDGFLIPHSEKFDLIPKFGRDVSPASIENADSARVLAADMASEVTLYFTCTSAYKDERGVYIEPFDVLSADYMQQGSQAAVNLLQKAGVRLGQILNAVSDLYYYRLHTSMESDENEPVSNGGWIKVGKNGGKRKPVKASRRPLKGARSPFDRQR
jgi:hypothetical protein